MFKRLSECTPDELWGTTWQPDIRGNCHENCPAAQHRHNNCAWARVKARMQPLHDVQPPVKLPETDRMDWSESKYGRPCPVKLLLLALGPVPKNKRPVCPKCRGAGCSACNNTGRDFYAALQGYGDDDAPKRMTAAGLMPKGDDD